MQTQPSKTTNGNTAAPVHEKRMTLAAVTKGRQADDPVRLLVYGVEGVGKSTLAAGAPNPIFLDKERGTRLLDVARFPDPETWQDVRDAVTALINEQHDYRTFAVDTLDWVEPLIWKHLCQRENVNSIEEVGGGFQKGYIAAADEFRILLSLLERLIREKQMNVILLAHSHVKNFKNPEGPDFDRYLLKLNDKIAGVAKEWSEAVLFANYETVAKEEKRKRAKGISTGARFLYCNRTAAYDAKNRFSLPDSLPLGWEELWGAIEIGAPADAAVLMASIEEGLKHATPDIATRVRTAIAKNPTSAAWLAQIEDHLIATLAGKGQ